MKPRNALIHPCRVTAIVLALATLGACADSGAKNWSRPGVTDSQRSADYAECRSEMRAVGKQSADIDQDIAAGRGRVGQYSAPQSTVSAADADYANRVMRDCMRDKGYRQ